MSAPEQDQQPDDTMPIAEAARQLGVPMARLYAWVRTGKLTALDTGGPRGGQRVSLAEARALVQDAPLSAARAQGFMALFEAAQLTGTPQGRIDSWVRSGKVATMPGPYGRLVCLTDVEAQARATQMNGQGGDYVTPGAAARHTRVPDSAIQWWAKRGAVRTMPGPYGQLVHLADVEALAAQRRHEDPVEGGE